MEKNGQKHSSEDGQKYMTWECDLQYSQKFGEHFLDFKDNWRLYNFFKTNLLTHFKQEGLSLPEEFYHVYNHNNNGIKPLVYKVYLIYYTD